MKFGALLLWSALILAAAQCRNAAAALNKKAEKCLLPMQSGRCFGYVPSYAYDPFSRKCEPFIYGGCGGNENRFLTKADCERNCRDV